MKHDMIAPASIAASERLYQTIQWELCGQPTDLIGHKKLHKFDGKTLSLLFKL